jgi:uncharacterized protein
MSSISEVDRGAWDALAGPMETPLLEWEWLRQMEVSGSISPETGWVPLHLTLWRDGLLVAAAPLYVKGHSSGEFVWDHMWADVAQQLGVRYYPKIIGMSPATPAVGYRFLVAPGEDEAAVTALMLEQIEQLARKNKISGCGFNFVDPTWKDLGEGLGYTAWQHQSYEWVNEGFTTFDDYLARFDKNQRRNIKRERASVSDAGVTLKALTGDEITASHLSLMYRYYLNTNNQFGPWAARFLTKKFFAGLEGYRQRLLLLAAFEQGTRDPIAMSFLLTKGPVLIGRYWGADKFVSNLHFDACYYAPIQWAIEHGVRRFDPGAGSPHKVRRGFQAVANYSLHRFYDEDMRRVMEKHIRQINRMEQQEIDGLNQALPFAERPAGRP